MPEFTLVAELGDVPPGTLRTVRAGAVTILVANLAGNIVAVNDMCTHAHCSLGQGELVDNNVMCPCHGAEFNLRTGHVEVGPATTSLGVYDVRIHNGGIEIADIGSR